MNFQPENYMTWTLFQLIKKREVYLQMLARVPGQVTYHNNLGRKVSEYHRDAANQFPDFDFGVWIDLQSLIDTAISNAFWEALGCPGIADPQLEDYEFPLSAVTPFGCVIVEGETMQ